MTFREDHIWQTQEANAEFAKVVKDAQEKGDQIITKRGEVVAIVV